MRLGIAKLEKLRFSFVSALTFHYLCSTNYKLRTVMETLEKIFAAKLLKVKAIKLQPTNPFTWASGWKSTPAGYMMRRLRGYLAAEGFEEINDRAGDAVEERHHLCKEAADAFVVGLDAEILRDGFAESDGRVRN